ncbi:MAG: HAD family hydrolase [Chlorobi bacterium]|nr:HAD family hydrolase [Chlorobiota bacterium]
MAVNIDLKIIKLIVFDLDGTLLNDENEIGEETQVLVKKLKNKGVKFSFATGRLHSAITEFAEILNITSPLISLDGAMLKRHPDGKIYNSNYIPTTQVKKIMGLAERNVAKLALCHADAVYYSEYDVVIPQVLDKYGAKFHEVNDYRDYEEETLEMVVTSDYKQAVQAVEKAISFPRFLGLKTNFYKTRTSGKYYFLEVRRWGASKGTGLNRLRKILKVKKSETAAIGDWYNDRELLKRAGVKVALQNAVPEIKRIADIVTERDHIEDGTAEFLETVLKAKGG